MDQLFRKVFTTVHNKRLFKKGDRVLLAVSGGPDSLTLFRVMMALRKKVGLNVYCVYMDHGLREADPKEEKRFVSMLCSSEKVKFFFVSFDTRAYAKKTGLSVEEAARELRYYNLKVLAEKIKANRIALGHTLTDNIETLLMRIIRGTGTRGLAGIPVKRRIAGNIEIVRPLADLARDEILSYLKKNRLSYCIDSSNDDVRYFRNRIRKELLPRLKRYNPRVVDNLENIIAIFSEEKAFWDKIIGDIIRKSVKKKRAGFEVDIKKIIVYNSLLIKKVLLALIPVEMNRYCLDAVLRLVKNGTTGKKVTLPAGWVLERSYNRLLCHKAYGTASRDFLYKISTSGVTEVKEAGKKIRTRQIKKPDNIEFGRDPFKVYFDLDLIDYTNLCVRNRRQGDRFQPFGHSREIKLKDFLIKSKIPRQDRDGLPVLVSGKDILWIAGIRQSQKAMITGKTRNILEVSVL